MLAIFNPEFPVTVVLLDSTADELYRQQSVVRMRWTTDELHCWQQIFYSKPHTKFDVTDHSTSLTSFFSGGQARAPPRLRRHPTPPLPLLQQLPAAAAQVSKQVDNLLLPT